MEAVTQELNLLKDEQNEITESIELSTQMLASASEEVDKARQTWFKNSAVHVPTRLSRNRNGLPRSGIGPWVNLLHCFA